MFRPEVASIWLESNITDGINSALCRSLFETGIGVIEWVVRDHCCKEVLCLICCGYNYDSNRILLERDLLNISIS